MSKIPGTGLVPVPPTPNQVATPSRALVRTPMNPVAGAGVPVLRDITTNPPPSGRTQRGKLLDVVV